MTDHDLFSTETAGLTEVAPSPGHPVGPRRPFRPVQAMTDFAARPLPVVAAGAEHGAGWFAAQDQLAALSTNSAQLTVADASHEALLIDRGAATRSAQGIRDVVSAVRSGGEMQP